MTETRLRITLAAAILAPVLLLVSTIGYLTEGGGMNDGELGGIVQVWGMIAYGIALAGFVRLLEDRTPAGALALGIVAVVGVAAGVAYGIDSVQVAVFGTEPVQETTSPAATLVFQLPGIFFPLSIVLLGVLLARTGTVPALLGGALVVGGVLFPASRIPDVEALAVTSDVIVLLALAAIVVRVTRSGMLRTQPSLDTAWPSTV